MDLWSTRGIETRDDGGIAAGKRGGMEGNDGKRKVEELVMEYGRGIGLWRLGKGIEG